MSFDSELMTESTTRYIPLPEKLLLREISECMLGPSVIIKK